MGPRIVVFSMGADRPLLSDEGRLIHSPVRPVKAVDAAGALDSFWAGFLVALLDGHPPKRCCLSIRQIAERKLATVGPLPDSMDCQDAYARIGAQGQPEG